MSSVLYRSNNNSWNGETEYINPDGGPGKPRVGVRSKPLPGIMQLNVSNKGSLGTIRRAALDIKCYSLDDLEAIEMMYMVPGMSVLIEWGWYHPRMSVDPIDVEEIESGQLLSNTKR